MSRELTREGHRERAKKEYLQSGMENMPDYKILELILFYAIPRRDVKEIAYALMNHFDGDLEKVLSADFSELQKVKGVGENTALLLTLFSDVSRRLQSNGNKNVTSLRSYTDAKDYAANCLAQLKNERVLVITLNNNLEIISCHTVSDGLVNCASVEPKKVVECAIKDNASALILAHNHPSGSFIPSKDDLSFTSFIYNTLRAINVELRDHIIVGDNGALSMNNDARYVHCFM